MFENELQNLQDNLITIGVLLGLFILGYCSFKKKTLGELIKDIREGMSGGINE